eukprot:g34887.t1
MVRDRKVLSFVANRAQVLYKVVSKPPLGLTDVEEATSGAADAVDHIGRCAGEHLSDVKGLFGAWDGGVGAGSREAFKLNKDGVRDQAYVGRKERMGGEGSYAEWQKVGKDAPQGSVLGS